MPRFRLTIEYQGTRYSGWQIQPNAKTIAGEIGHAVRTVTGRDRFELYGAGRTDAGVHALQQVAHLDVATTLSPALLVEGLNAALPHDIAIAGAEVASHRFHARRDATRRTYLYQITRRPVAFGKPLVWWVKEPLNSAAMQAAASHFVGLHDFRSFTDADAEETSTKVLVESVVVHDASPFVLVRIAGSHFLWKMVRRMVGVLVAVGTGQLREQEVAALLVRSSNVPARLTAPAAGLFLERVFYSEEDVDRPLTPVLML
ncbi:MAG: tRNA pseudouridine(38-40) synthase TruA [Vicinamibacterales bacterium]